VEPADPVFEATVVGIDVLDVINASYDAMARRDIDRTMRYPDLLDGGSY